MNSINSPRSLWSRRFHDAFKLAALLAAGLLFPLAAHAVTETYNTATNFNWTCPAGVTNLQVECWGGGGAGGAADYSGSASSGTINVAGGGGAGGAYARKANVPVTPGNSYNIAIPAAAAGAPAGTANGVLGATGGTVTFTGDSSTVVTAVGGQGGASRVSTTTATGAGGTGSTTGCVGDVVFAGGSCTVSTISGTCGGGGGGAGDANPGGSTSSNVGGAGGVSGGGLGGTGPTGGNNGNSGGAPGVAGGGSGGREQRTSTTGPYKGGDGGLGQIILTYTPVSANKLAVTAVPGSTTAGANFSVTVQAQDSGGTPINVTQDTAISLAASGAGTLSGNTATILNGNSSVTLTTVQYTKAESITLTASRTSGDVLATSVASAAFTVGHAAAAQLAFTTQPSASTEVSVAFATQPVVQIRDAFGNLVTTGADATVNVALTLTSGTGTLGGTTSINAVAGVADFAGQGLNINAAGSGKVLTATATVGAGVVTTNTSPFTITAVALTWLGSPATFDWNTTDVNWSGGSGVYVDPLSSSVTFGETGSDASPINLVGTLQPASVSVNADTKNYTFSTSGSGKISGTTGLSKSGSGTLTVATANDYTGETTNSGGILVMANPSALSTNTIRFLANTTNTLRIATDGGDNANNVITHSGTADVGAGTWTSDVTIMSGVATPGAGINHTLGRLDLALARLNIMAGPNVSGGNPKITFGEMRVNSGTPNNSALLNPTTASVSILGDVTTGNNNAKTLYLGGTSTGNEIVGAISVPVGTLAIIKTNAGTWTLSGANTYPGLTTVSEGTLKNGSATTFANNGQLTVNGTGTFDLNGNNATFTQINNGVNTGTIGNSGATAILKGTTQTVTISNLLTGTVALEVANANDADPMVALDNANTFSGGLTLLNGTGAGSRLRINSSTPITTVGSPGAIVSSPFGTGAITLGLANTDKAGIMISAAAHTLANEVVFNTALGTDIPGIRVESSGITLAGQITGALADATFASGNTGTGSATVTGKITGASGLALTPGSSATTSTLTLTLNNAAGDNDYAGNTTITNVGSSNYKLVLGAADQIPHGAAKGNVVNDGTLDLNTFSEAINGLSGSGIVDTIAGGSPVLTVGWNGQTSTFDGVIQNTAGTLALTKEGIGTLTLTDANTYGGNTTVATGTLALSGSGSIANSPAIAVAGGATLDVSALSSPFALGASQILSNSSSTAILQGDTDSGSGTVSLTYASGTPSFDIPSGTLTLASGTTFKVDNTGSALAHNSYLVISKSGSGAVTGVVPAVTIAGGGAAAPVSLQIVSGELFLNVNNAPMAKAASNYVAQGGSVTITNNPGKNPFATDADGDTLTYAVVTGAGAGTVTPQANGFLYESTGTTSNAWDTFTYSVTDGFGGAATNTMSVYIGSALGANLVSATEDGGLAYLIYAGVPDQSYVSERATNLTPPIVWSPVATNTAGAAAGPNPGKIFFTNTIVSPASFFRTQAQ